MAPLLGPSLRGYGWVGMSGKAMYQSIPPGGTDQEMTRRIGASEGHGAGVCGLLVLYKEALVAPNREAAIDSRRPGSN